MNNEIIEPTIAGIIAVVDQTLPDGWIWLLRSNEDGIYFANIYCRITEQRFPNRDKDMRKALYGSYKLWQMSQTVDDYDKIGQ